MFYGKWSAALRGNVFRSSCLCFMRTRAAFFPFSQRRFSGTEERGDFFRMRAGMNNGFVSKRVSCVWVCVWVLDCVSSYWKGGNRSFNNREVSDKRVFLSQILRLRDTIRTPSQRMQGLLVRRASASTFVKRTEYTEGQNFFDTGETTSSRPRSTIQF